MKNVLIGAFFLYHFTALAQVTKVGNDTLIDIACWNVEWLGETNFGPTDETLQFENVTTVLNNTQIDIWGLAEVSNTTTFTSMLVTANTYDGVISDFEATQKLALMWKKNKFTLLNHHNILTDVAYSNIFAGRPPLEVVLRSKGASITDTLFLYVVHFKANTGNQAAKVDAYARRQQASLALKAYVDQYRRNRKVIILGDWNDDLDRSILYNNGNYLATPFSDFLTDTNTYFFPTLALTKAGKKSTVSYSEMIDHVLTSKTLSDSFYVPNSCQVMEQIATQIPDYDNTTSDHYPVFSRYNFKRYKQTLQTGESDLSGNTFKIYPNPTSEFIQVDIEDEIASIKIVNSLGKSIDTYLSNSLLDIRAYPDGIYWLIIATTLGQHIQPIVIKH